MAALTADRVLAPVGTAGKLFAFGIDVAIALFRRPFQAREFLQQAWFIASVTIVPTALVAIPFGAVIALQVGGNAVFVNGYNRRISIIGSHISQAGGNGVAFVGGIDAVGVRIGTDGLLLREHARVVLGLLEDRERDLLLDVGGHGDGLVLGAVPVGQLLLDLLLAHVDDGPDPVQQRGAVGLVQLVEHGPVDADHPGGAVGHQRDALVVDDQPAGGLLDHLAHRYFDTARPIIEATVEEDLPKLISAAERMLVRLRPPLRPDS